MDLFRHFKEICLIFFNYIPTWNLYIYKRPINQLLYYNRIKFNMKILIITNNGKYIRNRYYIRNCWDVSKNIHIFDKYSSTHIYVNCLLYILWGLTKLPVIKLCADASILTFPSGILIQCLKPVTGHQLVVIIDGNIPWDSVSFLPKIKYVWSTWFDISDNTHCTKRWYYFCT